LGSRWRCRARRRSWISRPGRRSPFVRVSKQCMVSSGPCIQAVGWCGHGEGGPLRLLGEDPLPQHRDTGSSEIVEQCGSACKGHGEGLASAGDGGATTAAPCGVGLSPSRRPGGRKPAARARDVVRKSRTRVQSCRGGRWRCQAGWRRRACGCRSPRKGHEHRRRVGREPPRSGRSSAAPGREPVERRTHEPVCRRSRGCASVAGDLA
jgi:hypothetical protein